MNTEQKEDAVFFSAALPLIYLSVLILGFTVRYNIWMSSKINKTTASHTATDDQVMLMTIKKHTLEASLKDVFRAADRGRCLSTHLQLQTVPGAST